MIQKYQFIFDKIHQYAYNRIQVEIDDLKIAREIYDKYPTYIAFFKVDTEMQIEMILQMVMGMRLTRRVLEGNLNKSAD